MATDYYSVLGVPRDATSQDIKRAFRQIARECHPDVAGEEPEAAETFKKARVAYETLMDPTARARYDRRQARRGSGAPRGGGSFFEAFYRRTGEGTEARRHPTQTARDARRVNRRAANDNHLNLDDLFNDFGFGRQGRKSAKPGSDKPSGSGRVPRPGADIEVEVEVPRQVAARGGSVSAVYYRMQRSDSWRPGAANPGVVRVQDVADVRVIPGTNDGQVLVEKGLGDAGHHGGQYGDLLVRVRLVGDEPARGAREGGTSGPAWETTSVREPAFLDISVVEALLGSRVMIQTPGGQVRLTIPPCTSSGATFRVRAKGVGGADHHVVVRIVVPRTLDDASRRLIEEFAALHPEEPESR